MAFGHFLLGPHNFMVMALGPCVKWPSILSYTLILLRCAVEYSIINNNYLFGFDCFVKSYFHSLSILSKSSNSINSMLIRTKI